METPRKNKLEDIEDVSNFLEMSKKAKFDITVDEEEDSDFTCNKLPPLDATPIPVIELTKDDYELVNKTKEHLIEQYKEIEILEKDEKVWIMISNLAYNLFYTKLSNTKLFLLNILCEIIKQERQNSISKFDLLLQCLINKKYTFKTNKPRPLFDLFVHQNANSTDVYFDNKIRILFIKMQNIFNDYSSTSSFSPSNVRDSSVKGTGCERHSAICVSFDKPLLIRLDVKASIDGKIVHLVPFYKEEDDDIIRRLKKITNFDIVYDTTFTMAQANKTKVFNSKDTLNSYDKDEIILGSVDSIYVVNRGDFKTAKAYLTGSVAFKDSELINAIKEFD